MDNLGILVQAILSLKDTKASKDQIASELPKLESQLQSDKNTRVKVVAGLDIAKSKSLIQAQLNTLANQVSASPIKVEIDVNKDNKLNPIVKPILDRTAFKDIDSYIDAVAMKLSKTNFADFSEFFKNLKNSLNANSPEVKEAVSELVSALKLSPDNKEQIALSYKSLIEAIRNTIDDIDITNNKDFEINLADEIYRAATSIKEVQKQIQQTSNAVSNTISSDMDKTEEQTRETTTAIEEQTKATEKLKAVRESITRDANGQQIGRTSVYGDTGFTKTSRFDENDELTSYTETTNYEKLAKELAKATVEATKLQTKLDDVKARYEDVNATKPIKDDGHLQQLSNQYNIVQQAIEKVKAADSSTMSQMKANVDAEIKKLVSLERQFRNAEYAATSLREKDIGTVKESQTNDLNKFIAQINSAKIPVQSITSDIETLKTALANVTDKESLTAYLNQFDVVKTKFDSIKVTYNSITDAIKQLTALQNNTVFNKNASNPQVIQTKQEITQLLAEYQKLMVQMQGNITPEGLKSIGSQLTKLNADFNSVTTSAKSFEQSLRTDNGAEKFKQKVSILTAQIKEFQKVNTRSLKQYGDEYNRMLKELANPNLDTQGLDKIRVEFQNIKREINTAGIAGKNFFGRIKEQAAKFASWMSLTGVITGAWHEVKKMVTNVIELDNCLLELSKVSDLSATGLKSITKEAYEMGKQVGKTGTDVINAVTNFKRAGFDLKESMSFAKDALVLTNVAEGITDTGEAATALISIMKGYGDTSLEFSQKILDATNEVSNTQAINFDDLIDGSQRLSAVAKQAGVSYEQMLGILTGTNEVLQNIEKTASGQITIFTRLQGIQLPDEEDVMPVAKLQETINTATKGVVNIVDQTSGELRNVYDILNDINNVWDTLDKNTQEGIAFAAAGTRQKNVFLSMMENWENVESATKSAQNSLGSAAIENQKHLDSISGKLANLESAFQSLSQTVVNSDLIKFIVDSGTNILNIIEEIIKNLGTIPTILASIAAVKSFQNAG